MIILPDGISIHAPVKGATDAQRIRGRQSGISIHAPVKGATGFRQDHQHHRTISIHAPVKGATADPPCKDGWTVNFNPRSREGSDSST